MANCNHVAQAVMTLNGKYAAEVRCGNRVIHETDEYPTAPKALASALEWMLSHRDNPKATGCCNRRKRPRRKQ